MTEFKTRRFRLQRRHIKFLVFLTMILVWVTLYHSFDMGDKLSMSSISARIETLREWANRPYGPLLFILISIAFLLIHLPEIMVVITSSMIYDLWEAFIYSWIGCNIGLFLLFVISRFFLRDFFRPIFEKSFLAKFERKLETNGLTAMIMLRVILFLSPTMTWLLASSAVKLKDYVLGGMIGIVPGLLGIIWTVSKLKSSIGSEKAFFSPETIGLMAGFLVVFLAIMLIKRKYISGARVEAAPLSNSLEKE